MINLKSPQEIEQIARGGAIIGGLLREIEGRVAPGVSTAELSSKTMEARRMPGLYVIGEAVDVTGWLGGYNFQWAWASGWSAAQAL